jgi:SAM-dependent methyltransferase
MKSPAYWTPLCYEFFLRYVWRQSGHLRREQWKAIADWIPEGSHVVDVAAGTGRFHRDVLAGRVGGYLALDINPTFVEDMRRRGIDARCTDIRKDAIPVGDVVIILSALYHFKDKAHEMLGKLLDSARKRLIILESVGTEMTVSSWPNRIRAALANIGEGPIYDRFRKEELEALCNAFGPVEYQGSLPGNVYLCVLRGRHSGNRA